MPIETLWSARFLSQLLKLYPLSFSDLRHLAEKNMFWPFSPWRIIMNPKVAQSTGGSSLSIKEIWNQANSFIHKPSIVIHIFPTNPEETTSPKLQYLVKILNTSPRQKQRKCMVSRRFLCRWQPLNWRTILCDSFHLWSLWWSLCEISEFSRNPPSWEPPVSQALAKLSGKVHVWQLHTLSQPQEHSSRGPSCSNLCWQTTWRNVNGDKIGLLCFVCPENTNH